MTGNVYHDFATSDPDTGIDTDKAMHRVMYLGPDCNPHEWCETSDIAHAEDECLSLRRDGQVAWVESE